MSGWERLEAEKEKRAAFRQQQAPETTGVFTGTDIFYDPLKRDIAFAGTDVATMSELENIERQLYLRLLCEKGELVYYPEYGTHLYQMISKAMSPTRITEIKREVIETVMQDERVTGVEDVIVDIGQDDVLTISATVLVGKDKLNIVLEDVK